MISKNMISGEQLTETLNRQEQVRVKLGLIAVSEGLITLQQAEEINRLQATCDKRFGDIAIEKGYMTEAQLDKILKMQGNAYLVFVQSLVDEGVIKMGEMEGILEEFRKEKGYCISDMEALKSDDIEKIVPLFLSQEAEEFEDIIGVAVRTIIRCIDRHVYLERAEIIPEISDAVAVTQKMEGMKPKVTGFVEADGGMVKIASVYGREEFDGVNEDVLDAAGEFLNCINGLYSAAMSNKSVELELMPPEYHEKDGKISGSKICRIPLWIQNKKIYFVVSE
ncbi:MAG: hypothetical protein PUF12_00635 [Thermoflexaceae bacterium]|nr:hypothetical protein [Thermoflexaceae bacterium]